jgi:hypothetical protein
MIRRAAATAARTIQPAVDIVLIEAPAAGVTLVGLAPRA